MATARPAAGFLERLFGRRPEPERPEVALPRVPTADDLLAALARVESMVARGRRAGGRRLPGDAGSCRTVRDTIPRARQLGSGSPQAYSVMATATDYLPEAVGGYLRLPREFADSRPVDRGKTSLMVLIDQLDLLAATMDKVFDAVCRADAAALVAHGRFLAEKFGHASTGGDLALVDPAARSTATAARLAPRTRTRPAARPLARAAEARRERRPRGRRPRSATPCGALESLRRGPGVAADAPGRGRRPGRGVAESARAAGDWAAATGGGAPRTSSTPRSGAPLARLPHRDADARWSPQARRAAAYARRLAEVASAACDARRAHDAGGRQRVGRRRRPAAGDPDAGRRAASRPRRRPAAAPPGRRTDPP